MIDLSHRKTPLRASRKVETDSSGFVNLAKEPAKETAGSDASSSENSNFFGFMSGSSGSDFSGETKEGEGYTKREVDTRIEALDNKLYKIEQRLELIERKLGINESSGSEQNVNPFGW